jgi:hypothetical protein
VEGDAVALRQALEVGVVGDDRRDLDVQAAGAAAEQQVVQAVAEPGHHDQGAGRRRRVPQGPGDAVGLGDGAESVTQDFQVRVRIGNIEVDPHEETALESIIELLALQDVSRVPDEKAAHGVDQSRTVGAREGEDVLTARYRSRKLGGHVGLRRCVLHNMVSDTQHGRLGGRSGQGRPVNCARSRAHRRARDRVRSRPVRLSP